MLTIILAVIVVLLAVAVAILVRRNRRNVKKAEFLFNALDNGDYSFRFNEQGMWDSNKAINAALNRVKEILQHARDEQMEKEKYFEPNLPKILNPNNFGIYPLYSFSFGFKSGYAMRNA